LRRLLPLPLLVAFALLLSACTPAAAPGKPADQPAPAAPTPLAVASPGGSPNAASQIGATPASKTFSVGVYQLVSHPALDASRQGAIQALADAGFKEGDNIKYDVQNGQGDIATMTSIAQRFRDSNVDLIIAISTPALQAALNVTKDSQKPVIVFDSVTDPYSAAKDLITSASDKPPHVTGIQAMPPVNDAMALARNVVPDAKRFGMIWTPAEANSTVATSLARDAAKELGVELIEQTVAKSDEVLQAAQSLVSKNIDLFFVSTDSTVVAALESLVKVATENKKPLFGNDPDSASRGAVAALGIDYFDQGYDSGAMAAQILKGEKSAKDIPIRQSKKAILAVNLAAAQQQGITLSDDLVKQAQQRYGEIVPARPKP
jgi:putative tryptophan/tyrosine transport system substrate-binding protein